MYYYQVDISQDDGRAVSYVRKETLLALYIRADGDKAAKEKLDMFKKLFPHPTYTEPKKLWAVTGWMVFMAFPHAYDVVWNVYRWKNDTTFFCSVRIADVSLDELTFF